MGVIGERGQMTVELAVIFPAVVVVCAITVNALLFISECAAFDREFPQVVRLYSVPAYGETTEGSSGAVQDALSERFAKEYLSVSVSSARDGSACVRFVGELLFRPTLFGMGLRDEFFGIRLPQIAHRAEYVVDSYRSGVVV